MVTLLKRYWGYLLLIITLPKIIDSVYQIYWCDLLVMKNINAPDLLNYIGTIIGGIVSLIAIKVAIEQFKVEKKPVIVPRNKHFFISQISTGVQIHETLEIDIIKNNIEGDNVLIELENITDNTAIDFEVEVDYKRGKLYKEVCELIGGEPSHKLSSNYDRLELRKLGVFNSNSTKMLPVPHDLIYIVKGVHYRLTEPGIDANNLGKRKNHFISKNYKIAELILRAKDINGRYNTTVFDIEISLSRVLLEDKTYEVVFTFVMNEKETIRLNSKGH